MPTLPEPILQTALLGIPLIPLVIDIVCGILGLTMILIFHGISINHFIMTFDSRTKLNLSNGQYRRVFLHFYATFIFIALIHICEIVLWAIYIMELKIMDEGVKALVFVGSCYTTVGFAADDLPAGWKSLAFFIAFSGLFSLAWTTSVMIGMTETYKAAWNLKYAKDASKSS